MKNYKYRLYTVYKSKRKKISEPSYNLDAIQAMKHVQMNNPRVKQCWVEYFEDGKWVSQI